MEPFFLSDYPNTIHRLQQTRKAHLYRSMLSLDWPQVHKPVICTGYNKWCHSSWCLTKHKEKQNQMWCLCWLLQSAEMQTAVCDSCEYGRWLACVCMCGWEQIQWGIPSTSPTLNRTYPPIWPPDLWVIYSTELHSVAKIQVSLSAKFWISEDVVKKRTLSIWPKWHFLSQGR